jgi:dCTP deaminase
MSSILNNEEIIEEIAKGNIIIDEFNLKNLGNNSYDVCLGRYYYKELNLEEFPQNYICPYDESSIKRWGNVKTAQHVDGFDGEWIIIDPMDTILAHTEEFIGGRNNITTMIKSRSSTMRNDISMVKCAGMGDVGYINRWTLEITNHSKYRKVMLKVGSRYAQVVFFRISEVKDEKLYHADGKYQNAIDLDELKKIWKPEDMLPRKYRDY